MRTSPDQHDPLWTQVRRLLIGTVVECLEAAGVEVALQHLEVQFAPECELSVPRLDNYVRVKGVLAARWIAEPNPQALAKVEVGLRQAWSSLFSVIVIPVGDKLTPDRADVIVNLDRENQRVRVTFDLEAD